MPLPHNLFDYCSIRKSNFIEKYLVVKRKISFVYKADILLTKLIIRGVTIMKLTTKDLCLTALFTAIVFVMTFVPKIPIPLGYAHLGDAAVLLAVVLLGRKQGAIAGAVGSALADLIGGFALWIVPTLLIKYIMAWIFGILYKSNHNRFAINGGNLTAIFLGLVWMVAAYTIFGAVLYDSIEAGLSSTPGLALKALLNAIIFLILVKPLQKISL